MMQSPQFTQLNEAVNRFQAELDRKITMDDPEEVRRWVTQVRKRFDSLEQILSTQRRRIHEKLFSEIADQDPSEWQHIRELRTADRHVEQLLDIVKSQLIALDLQTRTDDEARISQQASGDIQVLEIIDRGSELTHWIRNQESSVTTWFAETFANCVEES